MLSGKELVSIIKTCYKSNVTRISIADIEIEFDGYVPQEPPVYDYVETEENPDKTASDIDLQLEDLEADTLLCEDPLAYESKFMGMNALP